MTTQTAPDDLATIRKALDWIGCLDGRDSIVEAMDKAQEDALQALERIELRLLARPITIFTGDPDA